MQKTALYFTGTEAPVPAPIPSIPIHRIWSATPKTGSSMANTVTIPTVQLMASAM